MFLNKIECCISVWRPAVRTQKYVAYKCITHSTGKGNKQPLGVSYVSRITKNKKLLFW